MRDPRFQEGQLSLDVIFFIIVTAITVGHFEAHSNAIGHPVNDIFLKLVFDKGLHAIVVGTVFGVQMHNVEDILPQVVVLFNVFREAAFDCPIKNQVLEIANVAPVMRIEIILTLLVTQLGERIDDNTENDIQTYDIDNDLEARIVRQLEQVLLRLIVEVHRFGNVADAATVSEALVELCDKALEHG